MNDLQGQKFGRLTVLEQLSEEEKRQHLPSSFLIWRCRCECGNIIEVVSGNLRSGNTKSCGCFGLERKEEMHYRHGDARFRKRLEARLYRTWCDMKKRCNNPNVINYQSYGGRGIRVCREWADDYLAFKEWALLHGYADDLTIDRINGSGDYSPENCQWLTRSENGKKRWRLWRKRKAIELLKLKDFCPSHLDEELYREEMKMKAGII